MQNSNSTVQEQFINTNSHFKYRQKKNQYNVLQASQQNEPTQQGNQTIVNVQVPTSIPKKSPQNIVSLSQIRFIIKKHLQELPEQFRKNVDSCQDFKSLNNRIVCTTGLLMFGHVVLNGKKKWFKLTFNESLMRRNGIALIGFSLFTDLLYTFSYRYLIQENRSFVQNLLLQEGLTNSIL